MKNIKLALLLIILLAGCSKEGDEGEILNPNSNFVAEIDSERFAVTEDTDDYTEASVEVEDEYYIFIIEAYDFDIDNGRGRTIAFFFTGGDFDELKPGDDFPNTDFMFGSDTYGYYHDYRVLGNSFIGEGDAQDDFADIRIRITAIDRANQRISGEFSFTVYDEDNDKYYRITDGKFRDIPFED